MSTVIRIRAETFKKIRRLKVHPRETDGDVVERAIAALEEKK